VGGDQDIIGRVSRSPLSPVGATSLERVTGASISFDDVAGAICAEVESSWPGEWKRGEVPPPAADGVPDFSDPAWTWRR
jgi:hypothetical protein